MITPLNPPGANAWRSRHDVPRAQPGRGWKQLSPAELFIGSFLLLSVLGTIGLKTLPGLYTGEGLSWNQAAFTATSAVCVTGLIVVDTATYFTFRGQLFLLLLIQLGGLGMLVLTSVIITALGRRPSLRTEAVAASSRDALPQIPSRKLVRDVVLFTAIIEFIGASLIYLAWMPRLGLREALWPAIFHSISSFCNAGFSTNTDSLMGFRDSPFTLLIVSLLIVAGGIGFVTMEELTLRYSRGKKRIPRLSVHSQLVLSSTAGLLLLGWLLFACFEWRQTLSELGWIDKLANSLFMSVTSRTAGFNTIDYAAATESTNFLTILLMMIGGCPGSTAGGMKTTTFMLLGLLAWCKLRSRATVSFHDWSIPDDTIQRAIGLFVIATGIIVMGMFLVTLLAGGTSLPDPFLSRLFEVVSAFNTVGLSMGVTPELTGPAQWVIIVLMFVGRTGPLAFASALTLRLSTRGRFRLAYEDVVVG
ncbi:MAG: TrkH family potassium uptake protein [Planctomycetaceae bacterium]